MKRESQSFLRTFFSYELKSGPVDSHTLFL